MIKDSNDFVINVWLKKVTQMCPRILEVTTQRVSNFKFFFSGEHVPGTPPEGLVVEQHTTLVTQHNSIHPPTKLR